MEGCTVGPSETKEPGERRYSVAGGGKGVPSYPVQLPCPVGIVRKPNITTSRSTKCMFMTKEEDY